MSMRSPPPRFHGETQFATLAHMSDMIRPCLLGWPLAFGIRGGATALNIVLVYEDLEMGLLGKSICERIYLESEAQNPAPPSVWRFDMLQVIGVRGAVTRLAAEAAILIVAPRNPERLSAAVNVWLNEGQVSRHPGPAALVALFYADSHPRIKSSKAALLLQEAAIRMNRDFFCHAGFAESFPTCSPKSRFVANSKRQVPAQRCWPEPFNVSRAA